MELVLFWRGILTLKAGQKKLPFHYGWIVLSLSFLGLFATFGIRASFGAYVTSWEEEFVISRTVVAVISTLSFITFAVFQPLAGRLSDRFGTRIVLTGSLFLVGISLVMSAMATQLWQLIILYGVIGSIGLAGGSNVTATAILTRWFVANRGLAVGLAISGMAVGQLVLAPVSLYLIANYDWRFSLTAIGLAIIFIIAPLCSAFIRSKPEDMSLKPYGDIEESKKEEINPVSNQGTAVNASIFAVMKERTFWALTLPYFVCGFTDIGLIGTHFIPFAEGRGFSLAIIATAFSIIAIANIIGTIGTGYLSDRLNRSKLLAAIYGIRGVIFVLLLTAESPVALIIFALVYGLTEMASIAPTSSLCAHLFNQYSIGAVFGFVSVSHQLGAAFGSLVPGILYDLSGSYGISIAISIALLWGSGLLVMKVPDPQKGSFSLTSGKTA